MHVTQHPSHFEPRLLPEYVDRFCQEVADVAYSALEDSSSAYDTNYTRGTLLFGRQQGLCKLLAADKSMPWLQLRNATLDFTVAINNVLLQIVTDNPNEMKKAYRIKPNPLEQHQLSLFERSPEICTWRVYVSSNNDLEFPKVEVAIVGFDANLNVICLWKHEERSLLSVRATVQHDAVDVPEAEVQRKRKDVDSNATDNDEPVDG
ncbi:hypothetical protein [Pseudomonas sp. BP8]|uniref:hypothetical protein n=1 Tax=Pseudomonas sp. BP8 TaxID=2817864 RepID=UPI001AEAB6D8|nr:hypothetical protein [Pseudomonas sp. BP8]MBP2263534.1 hypothetical protein [Pseudomonas sp. BP8]HDS1735199.1 hypothetical protein [Pseudomonas putida]